jgi:ubiquinol-cytochrome c reductase cytochrome b subunit
MLNWLEDRIRLKTVWRHFLEERLPDRIGWPHVLGSVLVALIAFQFLTGLLLSFVYSASPDGAHASVRHISQQMRGGSWLRSLHYWGASFLVVIAGLHLIRTFVYAAYRRPRELTWIAGVLLFFCILAFGQTGYLLPWDQRAYWGTTVTLQIVRTVPLAGPALAQLLRGGDSVGAQTLSRFYSFHVVILPVFTILLVGFHLALIRRYGITQPWSRTDAESVRRIPFYPYQMAKDAAAVLIVLSILIWMASQLHAPLDSPADPSDTTFVPRPDWYFLFLFQMLRYFEGKWEVVGTFLIPSGLSVLLLCLPFLDRNPRRELRRRPIALVGMIFGLALFGWLTYAAIQETPQQPAVRPTGMMPPRSERIKRPAEVGGVYLLKSYCFECHSMTQLGSRPDLQTLAKNRFPSGGAWLQTHLDTVGADLRPALENGDQNSLSDKEVDEMMSALRLVAGDRTDVLASIPPKVRFGAHFFYNSSCPVCHTIDGQGGKEPEVPSPDLTLRLLRTKEWHIKHIHDPQSVVRNSKMPPFFHYERHEYEALAEYILYLHTP